MFTVAAPIRRVWEFLVDVDRVAACMPGCEKVEHIDADSFFMTVKASVGIIAAEFKMRVTMTEKAPPITSPRWWRGRTRSWGAG